MLSRHSWEAYVYNRPDQFEIKCNAILFTVYSWLHYHMPASEAFALHKGNFYLVARIYTAFFGIGMIPLMALFTGKLLNRDKISGDAKCCAQLLAAGLTAFSPIFIQHSAYATPDIPVACLSLLTAYLSLYYLESGSRKWLCAIAVLTGICITIKYPAAVMCLYIAFIVIYRAVKEKDYKKIIVEGMVCIGWILATMFIIAPNLFTDCQKAVETFLAEARPNHLGADGLGFWGNLKFYFYEMRNSMGILAVLSFLVGAVFLARHWAIQHVGLVISGIYWICLSVLSLHWQRWGMPMFPAYVVLVSIGGVWSLELTRQWKTQKPVIQIALFVAVGLGVGLICLNTFISGIVMTKWSMALDTRIAAMDFCEEHGITTVNSIYEGYTPLATDFGSGDQVGQFVLVDGRVQTIETQATKEYYVLSSSFRGRYRAAAAQYPEKAAIYNALDSSYALIYRLDGTGYQKSMYEVQNIIYGIQYLLKADVLTGNSIYIYDLAPQRVLLRPYTQQTLCVAAEGNEEGSKLVLSAEDYVWIRYVNGDRTSFISDAINQAMDVTRADFSEGTQVELWQITGGSAQGWSVQQEGDYVYILTQNGMALSYEREQMILQKFAGQENQRWSIDVP